MRDLCILFLAAMSAQVSTAQDPARAVEIHGDGTVTVYGRVVFTDLDGKRHAHVRGQAQLELAVAPEDHTPAYSSPLDCEVEIVDGRWSASFNACGKPVGISMWNCTIGSATVLVEPEHLALHDGVVPVVRLHAIPEPRVRVVDALTKEELLGRIEVVCDRQWRYVPDRDVYVGVVPRRCEGFAHPGDVEIEPSIAEARSPFVVPTQTRVVGRDERIRLWVRANGYAWQQIELFAAQSDTCEVALVRAGSLQVTLRGKHPEPPAKVALRLYESAHGRAPLTEVMLDAPRAVMLDGLAPARYEVRVELGDWFDQPRVLTKGEALVTAGGLTFLELNLRSTVEAPARTTVRGLLKIPAPWRTSLPQSATLTFDPVGATRHWADVRRVYCDQLEPGKKPGELRLEFADVLAGRYHVVVSPGLHRAVLAVPESGVPDLEIAVPPPAQVVLHLVDGVTNKPRNHVRVLWHPQVSAAAPDWPAESVDANAGTNTVHFFAPEGRITVSALGDDYDIEEQNLDLGPGRNVIELKTRPIFGVKVALYEGSVRIPLVQHSGWRAALHTVDGRPFARRTRGTDTLLATNTGRYILRVEAPDAYQPVPERPVTLSPGPFPTIEIKVARNR